MKEGFIKIHRKMFDHYAFQEPYSKFQAFSWMIAEAAWQDGETEAGQFISTYRQMAYHFEWSVKKLRCFLEFLQNEKMIVLGRGTRKGTNCGTPPSLITICNYTKYQTANAARAQPGAQAGAHLEEEKKPKTSSTHSKTSLLKEDYVPEKKTREWALKLRPDLDLDDTLENFKNYHIAKGNRFKIWDLAFRNWVKRERPNGQRAHGSQQQKPRSAEDVAASRRQKADRVFDALGVESPWDGPGAPGGDAEPSQAGSREAVGGEEPGFLDFTRDRDGSFQADPDIPLRQSGGGGSDLP